MNFTPIAPIHEPAVLALNNAHARELSWLDSPALSAIVAQAFYAQLIAPAEAFLLALDHTASYDSPNYLWLKARHDRFIYIDRIAVADRARGRGHARALYEDLFALARAAGHTVVVCEVNVDPPNPPSDAFHAALGFREIGRAVLEERGKTVRYFAKVL